MHRMNGTEIKGLLAMAGGLFVLWKILVLRGSPDEGAVQAYAGAGTAKKDCKF